MACAWQMNFGAQKVVGKDFLRIFVDMNRY